MNALNATAHPVPRAPFNSPALSRDDGRVLEARIGGMFPEGALRFVVRGRELGGIVALDGVEHTRWGFTAYQLSTYLAELHAELSIHAPNLARRTRASEAA